MDLSDLVQTEHQPYECPEHCTRQGPGARYIWNLVGDRLDCLQNHQLLKFSYNGERYCHFHIWHVIYPYLHCLLEATLSVMATGHLSFENVYPSRLLQIALLILGHSTSVSFHKNNVVRSSTLTTEFLYHIRTLNS